MDKCYDKIDARAPESGSECCCKSNVRYEKLVLCKSYSTKVLYSRDHAGVSVAYDRISPQKPASILPFDNMASLQIDLKCSQQVAKRILMEFSND